MTAPATGPRADSVTAGQVATYSLEAATAARASQLAIRAALMQDVVKLWPLLKRERLSETFPGWLQAMTLLLGNYHGQSSAAAGTFYRTARAHALQSPTPTSLIKSPPPPSSQWVSRALGFSGPGMLSRKTTQPGSALSTTLGTSSRIALNGGRATIAQTTQHDPAAIGWFFLTDGAPCHWCAMIASRGVVFKEHSMDRSNAHFIGDGTAKVHNQCGCALAPAFSRSQQLPSINDAADEVWRRSTAGLSGDAARAAFREAWAAYQADNA